MRKITGGEKQLTLNNNRFVKFVFLNPRPGYIDLQKASKREAYIRYEDPATNMICVPERGYVKIQSLDETNKLVSGEFEMDFTLRVPGKTTQVKVTEGKFINVPLVFK
ncbi:MAG: DUF6252 family protein [Cytophagaceae bacterium]|nr:DUF6252 family protein [Cytophagaceae bacterium]MDW8456803.1 DUF6252 family protein [Cytophagaceae bacterium]